MLKGIISKQRGMCCEEVQRSFYLQFGTTVCVERKKEKIGGAAREIKTAAAHHVVPN